MDTTGTITDVDTTEYIYSPETLISPHTGKPISDPLDIDSKIRPKFWCPLCDVHLSTPVQARQHTTGRSHLYKYSQKYSPRAIKKESKRKIDPVQQSTTTTQEPVTKKSKKPTKETSDTPIAVANDENSKKKAATKTVPGKDETITTVRCEDCNIDIANQIAAIQHFKGKKHIKVVTAKIVAKRNQPHVVQTGQTGGAKKGRNARRGGQGANAFRRQRTGQMDYRNNRNNFYDVSDRNNVGNDIASDYTSDFTPEDMNPNTVYGHLMNSLHGEIHRLKQRLHQI